MKAACPAPLRAYSMAADAATPLSPLLLAWRRAKGKEDASRLGERRGLAEPAEAGGAPGLDPRGERRRDRDDPAARREALASGPRDPHHLGDGHLGQGRGRPAAQGRSPSVHPPRPAPLRPALSRPLAARRRHLRRIGAVADDTHRGGAQEHPYRPRQCADVAALLRAMAARAAQHRRPSRPDLPLPRPERCGRRALLGARRVARPGRRQPQVRCAATPRGRFGARYLARDDRRQAGPRCREHPSGRGGHASPPLMRC